MTPLKRLILKVDAVKEGNDILRQDRINSVAQNDEIYVGANRWWVQK
jgi:hypothetical protein